tara:strand:+ start:8543 stop:9889 length:1347 start_codon:yes stop_codon:yes gene_type:complete
MATHDYDIANQSGANFRADLNNVLDAIVSNNSNSSDPSTTFAYMWWVDTSNNVLKLRNSANNAWITLPMSITASNTITPTLNMGTGAEEDVKIVFDGNAQDFYIGLDDSADDLIIGKGSTVGTTPAIVIDENQKVGIGDTPDLAALHVKTADSGASADSGADELVLENSGDTGMTILSGTTNTGSIRFGDSGDSDEGILIYSHGSDPFMRLFVGGAEEFRLTDAGNLHLSGGSDRRIQLGSGGAGANTVGNNTVHIRGESADMKLMVASGGQYIFEQNGTERTRIETNGRLLLNKTASQSTPSRFDVTRSSGEHAINTFVNSTGNSTIVAFWNPNGIVGTINTSGSTTSYNTSSDARLKNIIGEAKGLEIINNLKPVNFEWKSSGEKADGLIAQEVEEVFPQAVSAPELEGEWYSVDYSKVVTPLIKGMQEQQEQIKELKKEIETLKN